MGEYDCTCVKGEEPDLGCLEHGDWWLNGQKVTLKELIDSYKADTPGLYGFGLSSFLDG